MPYYFAYRSRAGRSTATAVTINGTTYEPSEPTRVKLFPMISAYSILTSIWTSIVCLIVSALSYPKGAYYPFTIEGAPPERANTLLPFRTIGLAFAIKKGAELSQDLENELSEKGFRTMKYNRITLYYKENAGRSDYVYVDENIPNVDNAKQVPSRFLTPEAFRAFLILMNITAVICSGLHAACQGDENQLRNRGADIMKPSQADQTGMDVEEGEEGEIVEMIDNRRLKIPAQREEDIGDTEWTSFLTDVFVFHPTKTLNYTTPAGVINPYDTVSLPFINAGDADSITSHGMIMKFVPALALPDINSVVDILGMYFMRLLGETQEDQITLFEELKRGISLLKLTRVGDELAHLYRCIALSIECRAGMVPFFSGSAYEGSVIMGGEGCNISVPGESTVWSFQKVKDLKAQFATVSSHYIALKDISDKFPEDLRTTIRRATSLMELREYCLEAKVSADDVQYIVGRAADLTFENDTHWPVNPANIKKAMNIISGTLALDDASIPITRHCLFSKDLVLIGLSVFGEKNAPSWNIPSGTLKKLSGAPPRAPQPAENGKGRSKGGIISDADWVMLVRRTDLRTAVDDFREMVKLGGYRTSTGLLGRKQGYSVMGPDRMVEFWTDMQEAYRKVDPSFVVSGEGVVEKESRKRERASLESQKDRALKRMKF